MIRLYVNVPGLAADLPYVLVDITVLPNGELFPNHSTQNNSLITNIVFIPVNGGLTPEQLEVVRKLGEENEVVVAFAEN